MISSDLAFLDFLDIEFRSDIDSFIYAPDSIQLDEACPEIRFIAHRRGCDPEAHYISSSTEANFDTEGLCQKCREVGYELVIVSRASIEARLVRIRNCLRMLRYLRAARSAQLSPHMNSVVMLLSSTAGSRTLLEIAQLHEAGEAIGLASVFKLYQTGVLDLEIAQEPLSQKTAVRLLP